MPRVPTLRVGHGVRPFAIQEPVPMPGFGARTALSTGTAEPAPVASALAFDDVVLVSLDTIGVDPALRDEIAAAAPGPGTLLVVATHTHAGPGILPGRLGAWSATARSAVVAAAAQAVADSLASARPATLEWLDPIVPGAGGGASTGYPLAHDRRLGVLSTEARLRAVRWSYDGVPAGVLACYPCHPTVVGPDNTLLSPDYPGAVRAALGTTGLDCVTVTGCAGDLNAGHAVAASYQLGTSRGRTLADATRFGDALAHDLLSGRWTPLGDGGVTVDMTTVMSRQEPLTSATPTQQRATWETQLLDADDGTATLLRNWIAWSHRDDADRATTYELPVARVTIDGVELMFLPGEPFLAADDALQDGGRTMVIGYAGDVPGYLPDAGQYALGGYEVLDAHRYYGQPAPFAQGTLEQIVDAARALRTAAVMGA